MTISKIVLFGFEKEYREELQFVPMGIRYMLDLTGLKVGLESWQKLTKDERFSLLEMPNESTQDLMNFAERLKKWVRLRSEVEPKLIEPLDASLWTKEQATPESILIACEGAGLNLEKLDWKSLTELQRYVLWKLSQSRRQGDALKWAINEFST